MQTLEDLGHSSVLAIIMFSEALVDKEKYLGNHMQVYTTNCMDYETTLLVESQNSIVKAKLGVSTKMDIHKGIKMLKTQIRPFKRKKKQL